MILWVVFVGFEMSDYMLQTNLDMFWNLSNSNIETTTTNGKTKNDVFSVFSTRISPIIVHCTCVYAILHTSHIAEHIACICLNRKRICMLWFCALAWPSHVVSKAGKQSNQNISCAAGILVEFWVLLWFWSFLKHILIWTCSYVTYYTSYTPLQENKCFLWIL